MLKIFPRVLSINIALNKISNLMCMSKDFLEWQFNTLSLEISLFLLYGSRHSKMCLWAPVDSEDTD